jgi:hypothetical protein
LKAAFGAVAGKLTLAVLMVVGFFLYWFYGVDGIIIGAILGLVSISFTGKIAVAVFVEFLIHGVTFIAGAVVNPAVSVSIQLAASGFLVNLFLVAIVLVCASLLFSALPGMSKGMKVDIG